MLLPRRSYGKAWRRILHDQTADRIVDIVSQLPHVNATIIPFHVAPGLKETPLVDGDDARSRRCPPASTLVPRTELPSAADPARSRADLPTASGAPAPRWPGG